MANAQYPNASHRLCDSSELLRASHRLAAERIDKIARGEVVLWREGTEPADAPMSSAAPATLDLECVAAKKTGPPGIVRLKSVRPAPLSALRNVAAARKRRAVADYTMTR